jgi:hypothetical protein
MDRCHRLLFLLETIKFGHTHAAQPEGRDFKRAVTKFSQLHWGPLMTCDNGLIVKQHIIGMGVAQGFAARGFAAQAG